MEQAKVWRCAGGAHVLGMVVRNGSGVRQLALYRESLQPTADGLQGGGEVEVMAVVEGYVADVRCSICGRVRTWFPGEEAMRRVLESRQGESQQGESQQGESQQGGSQQGESLQPTAYSRQGKGESQQPTADGLREKSCQAAVKGGGDGNS